MMKSLELYSCRPADGKKPLCDIGFKFTEEKNNNSHFGRVETILFYPDPESKTHRLKRHINSQSWYQNPDGEYCMGITRFSLPPSLQGIGLGPVVWSELFKGLPESVRKRLKIFGSLNSGDAFTPQTGPDGKILFEIKNGQRKMKMINQIKRRNRFWESMTAPIDSKTSVLKCDEKGNGAFTGFFKNPLLKNSSKKIVLCKTGVDQNNAA